MDGWGSVHVDSWRPDVRPGRPYELSILLRFVRLISSTHHLEVFIQVPPGGSCVGSLRDYQWWYCAPEVRGCMWHWLPSTCTPVQKAKQQRSRPVCTLLGTIMEPNTTFSTPHRSGTKGDVPASDNGLSSTEDHTRGDGPSPLESAFPLPAKPETDGGDPISNKGPSSVEGDSWDDIRSVPHRSYDSCAQRRAHTFCLFLPPPLNV